MLASGLGYRQMINKVAEHLSEENVKSAIYIYKTPPRVQTALEVFQWLEEQGKLNCAEEIKMFLDTIDRKDLHGIVDSYVQQRPGPSTGLWISEWIHRPRNCGKISYIIVETWQLPCYRDFIHSCQLSWTRFRDIWPRPLIYIPHLLISILIVFFFSDIWSAGRL